MAETAGTPARKKKGSTIEWGFLNGAVFVLAAAIWLNFAVQVAVGARTEEGGGRFLYAIGFFLMVLPLLAALVYRWPTVFAFFRSVKVGVVNLAFIGLGAIFGVLFHQEDYNFPIPPDDGRHPVENGRYAHYLDFRAAHAYFVYHLTKDNVLRWLPKTGTLPTVDEEGIQAQMASLRTKIPELEDRFGEEFAVGIETSSERGLYTRSHNEAIRELEVAWDDFWWTLWNWSDRLDLLRVYKSWWYAAFWVILFFGVLSNTFRGGWRRLLRPGKWGFVVTHAGVLLIIVGGAIGRFSEQRGILELNIGRQGDRFQGYDQEVRRFGVDLPLVAHWLGSTEPFAVRLDGFRADHFDVLEVIYAREDAEGGTPEYEFRLDRQPKARVYEGQKLSYDYDENGQPALRIEVDRYVPQAETFWQIRPTRPGEDRAIPLARLATRRLQGGVQDEQILTPFVPRSYVDTYHGARVRYSLAESVEEFLDQLAEPVRPSYGVLRAVTPADASPKYPFDARPGATTTVLDGNREYRVEVLQGVPLLRLVRNAEGELDHKESPVPPSKQSPDNPAVKLRITSANGEVEERWVTQEQFHAPGRKFDNLDFEFLWDDWASSADSRWLVALLPDGRKLAGRVGDPDSLMEWEIGDALPTGPDHEVVIVEAYRQGVLEQDFKPLEEADFFHPAPAAVRLTVRTPDEPDGRDLVMEGTRGSLPQRVRYEGPDGEPRVVYLRFHPDMQDLPNEWRSRLTILESRGPHGEWEPVEQGEIRVNDYYFHGGYRFFQTNARPEDPTYSGIGVVYDPGIRTVLSGLYMLMFGTIVVFLVKPLFTRRHRGL